MGGFILARRAVSNSCLAMYVLHHTGHWAFTITWVRENKKISGWDFLNLFLFQTLTAWLPSQCNLDAVQPVSQQEPTTTWWGSDRCAARPGTTYLPLRQRSASRRLLGSVLPHRWIQWENRCKSLQHQWYLCLLCIAFLLWQWNKLLICLFHSVNNHLIRRVASAGSQIARLCNLV